MTSMDGIRDVTVVSLRLPHATLKKLLLPTLQMVIIVFVTSVIDVKVMLPCLNEDA